MRSGGSDGSGFLFINREPGARGASVHLSEQDAHRDDHSMPEPDTHTDGDEVSEAPQAEEGEPE